MTLLIKMHVWCTTHSFNKIKYILWRFTHVDFKSVNRICRNTIHIFQGKIALSQEKFGNNYLEIIFKNNWLKKLEQQLEKKSWQ